MSLGRDLQSATNTLHAHDLIIGTEILIVEAMSEVML